MKKPVPPSLAKHRRSPNGLAGLSTSREKKVRDPTDYFSEMIRKVEAHSQEGGNRSVRTFFRIGVGFERSGRTKAFF